MWRTAPAPAMDVGLTAGTVDPPAPARYVRSAF